MSEELSTTPSEEPKVPETVLQVLETVRAGGLTNMLDKSCVIDLVDELNEEAADWLRSHSRDYMTALRRMGERRTRDNLHDLEVLRRLVHLQARLRLRSPATPAEIKAWAELRRDALVVIEAAKEEP